MNQTAQSIPLRQIVRDFDLRSPEEALNFAAAYGLPRGLHYDEASDRLQVPVPNYSLFCTVARDYSHRDVEEPAI